MVPLPCSPSPLNSRSPSEEGVEESKEVGDDSDDGSGASQPVVRPLHSVRLQADDDARMAVPLPKSSTMEEDRAHARATAGKIVADLAREDGVVNGPLPEDQSPSDGAGEIPAADADGMPGYFLLL